MSEATRRAAMAERAARAGGTVAREAFRGPLAVETKARKNDLVTEADRNAQRQVLATIRREFADDRFVCEEAGRDDADHGSDVPETGNAWIVDPIDGTANFVRGTRFWATSVAALAGGDAVGVATYLPAETDCYAAGPNGVTRNGAPIEVSDRTEPETFAVSLIGWWPVGESAASATGFRSAAARFGDVRRLGCMQGVLALVASGGLEAAFTPDRPHPWDSVAGVHLVRRAGGIATDLHGDPWESGAQGLVVSNGTAHESILDAARAAAETWQSEA